MTIKDILNEMQSKVKNNEVVTPNYWIEKAIELVALWAELKEKELDAEMAFNRLVANSLEEGETSTSANRKAKATEEYRMYQYLRGRDKIIKEYIMLAKKRATVNNEFEY